MENWIKITFNEEGVGAFRIHFENTLPEEYQVYFDDEKVEDIIVNVENVEPEYLEAATQAGLERTIEFLTVNAYRMSEAVAISYIKQDDKDDTLLI